MDQGRAPFIECLRQYLGKGYRGYHTPGHRGGRAAWPPLKDLLGERALAADLTELPELDDLSAPRGSLLEAQKLAAEFFGAARTFFLVNGATAGLQAAFLACLKPGDTVLLPRHAHRSALAALALAGALPSYLMPAWQEDWAIPLGIGEAGLALGLRENPGARALLLINPSYEGLAPPVERLVEMAHRQGLLVIVDEAHGAHFALHPSLPAPALAAGADLVVQGTHKVLGAMTQAAMLHLREENLAGRVARALRLLTTTSPSFLLLASLDAARRQAAMEGRLILDKLYGELCQLRKALDDLPGVSVLDDEVSGLPEVGGLDWTRLAVRIEGVPGRLLADRLKREGGLEVEMAGFKHVLLLCSLGLEDGKGLGLLAALSRIAGRAKRPAGPVIPPPPAPLVALPPREALQAPMLRVGFREALGRLAADVVTPYPPGIPVLCPGEVVTPEVLDYLELCRAAGFHIQGSIDQELQTLGVIA